MALIGRFGERRALDRTPIRLFHPKSIRKQFTIRGLKESGNLIKNSRGNRRRFCGNKKAKFNSVQLIESSSLPPLFAAQAFCDVGSKGPFFLHSFLSFPALLGDEINFVQGPLLSALL